MPERNSGVRAILRLPVMYNLLQRSIAPTSSRQELVREYVRPAPGDRVLDIGCGTGAVLDHMSGVSYTGFDPSPSYIEAAREQRGTRGSFFVGTLGEVSSSDVGEFDIALAKGVLHHVDDQLAKQLFALAAAVLRPGGRLITYDGCYIPNQPRLARLIISRDRGQNVRTVDAYEALARTAFNRVEVHVRQDLLRVPYTHAILVCHNREEEVGTSRA